MTLLKKPKIYRKGAKNAKKFKVKFKIFFANQLVQMNIFTLLVKNLCALGVLAVKTTFFQGNHEMANG